MRRILFCFLLFFSLALSVCAQVTLSAVADKTALTLDDELTLTVRVSGVSGNLVMPQLPSLPAFNVYSREVEQNSINGKTSLIFRYTMLPRFVGQTSIGPVTFKYDGNTYKTEPIEVRVYRSGSAASTTLPPTAEPTAPRAQQQADAHLPPLEAALTNQAYAMGHQPFFMVAAVSNKTPYVNQAITLGIRFYYSRSFYDAPYQKPAVSNIFMEDAGSAEGTQNINGVLYRYQEQRYTLMGVAPGPATVGSASVTYHTGSSPLAALDRLFGGAIGGEEKTATSAPISLQIRALPPGQPRSFYGAVGQGYTFQAQAQPQQVEAGEAVNLTATVRGSANLKSTKDLVFPTLDGFKNYPSASSAYNGAGPDGKTYSYKTFKTVLVPSSSGIYTIPALEWSYFNPYSERYHTLQTAPITLTVTPGTKTSSGIDFSTAASTAPGFQTFGQDVHYLKTIHSHAENWLARLSDWKWIHALALFWVAACLFFASIGRKSLAEKKAFSVAKAQLKKAKAQTEVSEAIEKYLYQKFNIHTGSLTLREMTASLARKGVRPATVESFSLLWQRLEAARFAPAELGAQSSLDLSAQALEVLRLMEGETK